MPDVEAGTKVKIEKQAAQHLINEAIASKIKKYNTGVLEKLCDEIDKLDCEIGFEGFKDYIEVCQVLPLTGNELDYYRCWDMIDPKKARLEQEYQELIGNDPIMRRLYRHFSLCQTNDKFYKIESPKMKEIAEAGARLHER